MGDRTIAQVQSQLSRTVRNFIAGPREQESGAGRRGSGVASAGVRHLSRRTVSPIVPDSSLSGIYFALGEAMRRAHLLILLAWLLQTASWILPAVKGFLGSRIDHGIPGWAVFLSETCALRPCGVASADPWYGTAIKQGNPPCATVERNYSYRSATMGSTFAARCAGT